MLESEVSKSWTRRPAAQEQRIAIIGTSCSGKSTLARSLSQALEIPHIELDELHWKPDLVEREDKDFLPLVKRAASRESWVADGNYSVARQIIWPRATTIIWLNFPFSLVLYRAIKRSIKRVVTKERLYSGNVETLRHTFMSKESIILWVIKTHSKNRGKYTDLLSSNKVDGCDVKVFRTPQDLKNYVEELRSTVRNGHV